MLKRALSIFLIMLMPSSLEASWLSDITGINIDVPNGRISFGTPQPAAIPQMLQHLPQDAAQFFLNPAGNALAFAIRQAKAQARVDCQPMPQHVRVDLASFFPPSVFEGVCFNLYRPSFTLDNLLLGEMNMGAVTFEDVVVFANQENALNSELWAHELVHVQQYRSLGVETFAQIYSVGAANLENEAYSFQRFAHDRLASQQQAQYWTASSAWSPRAQISTQQYQAAARDFINPLTCSRKDNFPGMVRITNACPIPIRVVQFIEVNLFTGQQFPVACTTKLCILGPNTYSDWPEDPGFATALGQIVW